MGLLRRARLSGPTALCTWGSLLGWSLPRPVDLLEGWVLVVPDRPILLELQVSIQVHFGEGIDVKWDCGLVALLPRTFTDSGSGFTRHSAFK